MKVDLKPCPFCGGEGVLRTQEIKVCDFCGKEHEQMEFLELPYMDKVKDYARDKRGDIIRMVYIDKVVMKKVDICPECLYHIGDMIYQFDCIKKVNQNKPIVSVSVGITNAN